MWLEIFLGIQCAVLIILTTQRWDARKQLKLWSNALIIAALIYVGFVILTQTWSRLSIEIIAVFGYSVLAISGNRVNPIWVAIGWILHIGWDILVHYPTSAIAPGWYPGFCLGFDIVVGGYLLYLISQNAFDQTKKAQQE